MKQCSKCQQDKPFSDFKSDKRRPNGLAGICRICAAADNRAWRKANPESGKRRLPRKRIRPEGYLKKYSALWRKANPEKHRQNEKAWRKANPEKARAIRTARQARKRGAHGRHTGQQIKALLMMQGCKCANCLKSIKNKYHVDHIMPLVLGGSNDISNIQLLCAFCNQSKHSKAPDIWARENGRLL